MKSLNRRKELLGNLVKKERRKHLRIFQDPAGLIELDLSLKSLDAKTCSDVNAPNSKPPGFVIFNTRKPSLIKQRMESPPPMLKKSEEKEPLQKSSVLPTRNAKSRTSSSFGNPEKRESTQLSATLKSTSNFPKGKLEQFNSSLKSPTLKKASTQAKIKKPEESINKIMVDRNVLKTGIQPKEKKPIVENSTRLEGKTMEKRETPLLDREVENKEISKSATGFVGKEALIPHKQKHILTDIHTLDQQIQAYDFIR